MKTKLGNVTLAAFLAFVIGLIGLGAFALVYNMVHCPHCRGEHRDNR